MKTFLALLLVALGTAAVFAGDLKTLSAGDTAPGFTLKNYDGTEVVLDSVLKSNRCAVIMFIATQCPVSNAYNERMADLASGYSKKGIAFVAINSNKTEPAQEVAKHAKEHGFSFPVVKDPGNAIADKYGALVTPEIFVVDAAKSILYHGRIDDSRKADKVTKKDLDDALSALLGGKKVSTDQQKAFGCTIKRVEESGTR
ncbi:MAG TPA: thioredoxin family protein [Bacteroidota bacterium]|nr:thioredoxin family protein [Bacteroidota bacterium]